MNRLKSISSALAISLLAFGSVTAEEDAETRLLETNECVKCDLNNAELEGAKLRGQTLVEHIFIVQTQNMQIFAEQILQVQI